MSVERGRLPELLRRMRQPDFYPHPTADSISLIQTHISCVFLTGDFAYKVKKPVNFRFVDFSTLERRRYFCQEEIRLNQRGAPGIYLEVVTISDSGGGCCLGGPGEPIEYAVKMRQFPQGSLLRDLLARGELGAELIDRLAKTVADYHATAATNPHIAAFGEPARIKRVIDDNYAQTERFIGGPLTREQFEETRRFTDGFFQKCGNVLRSRITSGHVRECHGDLHLGNVCLWQDAVLLFDCIEFNESFRCVDVIQDAAFVAMDLEASGRADLSARFMNAYMERTGDWEGLQLLRLHLCRQAYVRAKVNSLLLNDVQVPRGEQQKAREKAAAYYRLAWQYSQPREGKLVLVSGMSGSGKSTLCRTLAERVGAVHIRSDAVRKHLLGVPLDQRGDESVYTPQVTDQTYTRLLDLGALTARSGFTVLLDAKYDRRAFRRTAIQRARSEGLPIQIIQCTAPNHVLLERLATRRDDISDAGPELLDRQRSEFEEFATVELPYVTVVDTTQPKHLPEFEGLL